MVDSKIPGSLRAVLAAALVSYTGSGLTLPFLLIYFHQVRHIQLGLAGLLIGAIGIVSLPVVPLVGAAVDKWQLRTMALVAMSLQALGTLSLVFATDLPTAVIAVLLYGIGQGATYPVWYVLLGALARDEKLRPRVFSVNSQLVNLGLGIGTFMGGLLVSVSSPASFVGIYLADGLSTLLIVAVLAVIPRAAFARSTSADRSGSRRPGHGGYRAVLADRRMARYLLASLALAIGGYGAMSVGYIGYSTGVVHATPRTIAWAIGLNTVLIVAAQPIALRITLRIRRTTALSLVAAFFAATWGVLGLAGRFPSSATGNGLVVAAQIVFAIGEIFLSPVASPLVNDLASDELRGRYNAAASTVSGLAAILSPVFAGFMLGAGLDTGYLIFPIVCCLAAIVLQRRLSTVLTSHENNVPVESRSDDRAQPAAAS